MSEYFSAIEWKNTMSRTRTKSASWKKVEGEVSESQTSCSLSNEQPQ
jgi:hypothetical protein